MNQFRIWLVVKPSVGVPILLIAVVVASLMVHVMILTHTTWYPAFLQGGQKAHAMLAPVLSAVGLA